MVMTGNVLTWTPGNEDVGNHHIIIQATDNHGASTTQDFTLVVKNVNDAPEFISTAPITAIEDERYVYNVQVNDVDQGDAVSLSLVSPPEGMNLANSSITWTPENKDVGAHLITIKAQDKAGASVEQKYTLTVANVNDAPVITSTPSNMAIALSQYTYQVAAEDVDTNDVLTYELTTAIAGMTINSTTGLVSWTPTMEQVGVHSAGVLAKDIALAQDLQTWEITVYDTTAPAKISVLLPNKGDEKWSAGTKQNIQWATIGKVDTVKIDYSTDNGTNWIPVITKLHNQGIYEWTVPNTPSPNCKVRVGDIDGDPSDISDSCFTILEGLSITVTAPNGRETFTPGGTAPILWTSAGAIEKVKIDLSIDNGASWGNIVLDVPDTARKYFWTVPEYVSDSCLVKVSSMVSGGPSDISDAIFRIKQQNTITVTSPNGGEEWIIGSSQYITWETKGAIDSVKVELTLDNGVNWIVISTKSENKNVFGLIIPDTVTEKCKIKLSDANDGTVFDISDSLFSIVPTIIPIKHIPKIPLKTHLASFGPNPVRTNLHIKFGLAQRGNVLIEIYSLKGRLIYRLEERGRIPGYYDVTWDCQDRYGAYVSTGVYLVRLVFGKMVYKKVLTVLK